jgi:hypothetical protein
MVGSWVLQYLAVNGDAFLHRSGGAGDTPLPERGHHSGCNSLA